MNYRLLTTLNIALLALTVAVVLAPSSGFAVADDTTAAATATEDVVYMTDGRELHGEILSETRSLVVFEYIDPTIQLKTKLTLLKDQIAHIERDVAVIAESKPTENNPAPAKPATGSAAGVKAPEAARNYGITRVQDKVQDVPSFYIVPMKGQMGTDINAEVYKRVVDDIKQLKPDIVVIEMDCQDTEDIVFSEKQQEDAGLADFDEYRNLIQLFRNDLKEFHQVCWIHDSMGISSMVAMGWQEMYMKPTARFGGLSVARQQTNFDRWQDADVRGKMTAAVMAWVKSFLESGGYSLVLADAMVLPRHTLSATWKGREVQWSLDNSGDYLVDGDEKRTVEFRAKDAEDFGISKGTAETLDDLALLLGYREFRVADGQADKLCSDYIEDWRRAYEDAKVLLVDIEQYMSWASGADTVKYLGRAKTAMEKILSYMERYKAVEIRLGREFGLTKQDLKVQIEMIQEQLRAARRSNTGGTGSGGRGGNGRGGAPM